MTVTQEPTLPYALTGWAGGYRTLAEERSYVIDDIEGTLPQALRGTLFRNGPGRFDRGGVSYQHPFDGDGMLVAVSFSEGRAHFQNRFVRTEGFIKESAAGQILMKNVFATLKPGGFLANAFDLSFKNVANTNVVHYGGRLMALWEAAPPHLLDPLTLDTYGQDDLGACSRGQAFSAHPRLDPTTGEMLSFGVRAGLGSTIYLYRLTPDGRGQVVGQFEVPGFAFIHDFVFTPNWWVFFQNPIAFDPLPFVLGFKAAGECLRLAPGEPTRILLVPRSGGPTLTLNSDPFFVFHHVNAFEQSGRVVVDSIRYDEYITTTPGRDFRDIDFDKLPESWLWRTEIDPARGSVQTRPLLQHSCEFPQVHPDRMGQPYRFTWAGATHAPGKNAPLQAIVKLDTHTGERQFCSFAPDGFVGEPVFVPREGNPVAEDDGWLLLIVYDAHRQSSDIWVLDAESLERICRLRLPHHLPYGFHGSFVPEVFVRF